MQYGAAQDQLRFGEEFGQIGCIGAFAGIAKKCNGRPDVQYHIVSNSRSPAVWQRGEPTLG
jgi:hypothetical protein